MSAKYLFVSVPASITPSGHKDDAIASVEKAANPSNGDVLPFSIPEFKIGTLDALLQQSDELAKLAALCHGVVGKVGDTLKNILDGDEEKIAMHKNVNDKPLEQYLRSFSWNKVKYRADRPLSELIDLLQKEANSIDNDVRSKYNQYNSLRTSLQSLIRKRTGNLSTKSLAPLITDPKILVQNQHSEHLETHLIAVPNSNVKEFMRTYETLAPMVVPRSATFVAQDQEYSLYAVTMFRKHAQEFVHKARERKWVPRDYKYKEGGKEEEERELKRVEAEEKRVWGETLRLGRTGWSEAVMCLVHVVVLRVFVETVLRYGLPLDYVAVLIKTDSKREKRVRQGLDSEYSYLAGNAFGRDKKGRLLKDEGTTQQDMVAGGEQGEYSAYVCYDIDVE
ncbi:V-type H+-transporting ATPase subunit C [Cladophialophora psammophila CBS 110553]|uniref:V-type proton ATPase subunit C n=1 Tax=Cladophialophora psammophila CBS 110553 TaxID=1182543 RepID=W9X2E7_9EURO|nr:V-type H+-transporting ATPase subunit C [Cladophialophora psammophila CBS 110553]EXJ71485.1 V-type H+-transporting ATPase subunit C [Cladophialophora psammophila CBS 110553]